MKGGRTPVAMWLLLAAMLLAAHHDLVLGCNWRWGDDVLEYAVPMSRFVLDSLARGDTPLWNPHEDCGAGLFSNPNFMGPFYPAAVLFLLPSGLALNLGFLVHIALAAVLTYLLGRRIGLLQTPAFFAAFIFAGSSAFRVQAASGYLPNAVSIALLPGVLAAMEWGLVGRRPFAAAGLAGAAGALAFLGGNIIGTFAILGAAGLYAGFRWAFSTGERLAAGRYWLPTYAAALTIGVVAATVTILPVVQAYLDSPPGAGRTLRVIEFLEWEPWRLLQTGVLGANPGLTGSLFVGLCGTVLAAVGVRGAAGTGRGVVVSLACTGGVLYLIFVSPSFGLYQLVERAFPPFGILSGPYVFADAIPLFIALFAGLGLQRLSNGTRTSRGDTHIAGAALASVGLFTAWYVIAYRANTQPDAARVIVPVVVAGAALAAVLAWRRRGGVAGWAVAAVFVIAGVETATYCAMSKDRLPLPYRDATYFDRTSITDAAVAVAPLYRILPYETQHLSESWQIRRNEGMLQGYHSAFGNAKIQTRRFTEFAALFSDALWLNQRPFIYMVQFRRSPPTIEMTERDLALLSMMGVRYISSDAPITGRGGAFLEKMEGTQLGVTALFKNTHALPRVYTMGRALTARDDGDALKMMAGPGFDPWGEVVLAGGPALDDGASCSSIFLDRYSNGIVTIDVRKCNGPVALILTEQFHQDWKATVDGASVRVFPANHLFRGVVIPAGDHRVEFRYRPVAFTVGAWLSALAWVGLLVAAAMAWRRGRGGLE